MKHLILTLILAMTAACAEHKPGSASYGGALASSYTAFQFRPTQFPAINENEDVDIPAVVVTPDGKVRIPGKGFLDTSQTSTAGIQEAINYSADYGWDLFVLGQSPRFPDGNYTLSKGLIFPPLQGKVIRFENVRLNFSSDVPVAIFIDSSMMVDFKLIGEINAPGGIGIQFMPLNPLPLDSILFNATGIVDSRFRVSNINSSSHSVVFSKNGGQGYYNDTFYFPNKATSIAGEESISVSLIETQAQVESAKVFELLGYDIFNPNAVIVSPPIGTIGSSAAVMAPDGPVDTTSTSTAGLQEALNYASVLSVPLVVYGRGLQNKFISATGHYPSNGFYQINDGLVFPMRQNTFITMYGVTLNYGPIGNVPSMLLQDMDSVNFEMAGQIVNFGNTAGVWLKPSFTGILNSNILLGHIAENSSEYNIKITPTRPITGNNIWMHEGFGAKYGFLIEDGEFSGNYVRSAHIHLDDITPLKISPAALAHNVFDLIVSP